MNVELNPNLISEVAPTKDGWYWAYENLEEGDADWLCVAVRGNKAYALELSFNLSEFSYWMGPFAVPDIPRNISKNRCCKGTKDCTKDHIYVESCNIQKELRIK